MHKALTNILMLTLFASGASLHAAELDRALALQMNAANRQLSDGDVDGAIEAYQSLQEQGVQRDDLAYNTAVARYRQGDVAAAAQQFAATAAADDDGLAAKSRFNLGNCEYVAGLHHAEKDRPVAIERFESAIRNYRSALAIDPTDSEARANIELASHMIEKLREEEKREEQQQPQPQDQQQQQEKQQNQQSNQQKQESSQSNEQQSDQRSEQNQSQSPSNQGESQESQQEQQNSEESQSDSSSEDAESEQDRQQVGNEQQPDESQQSASQSESKQSKDSTNQQSPTEEQQLREENGTSADKQQPSHDQAVTQGRRDHQNSSRQEQPQSEARSADSAENQAEPDAESAKKPPQGVLSTANQSEGDEVDHSQHAVAVPADKEGEMTEQEAQKMLQAIRDRDMVRRLRRQAAERSQHIPVDRDW